MSSSSSESSENTDSSSSNSSSPHLFNSDPLNPLNPANQDSSSETLLIDTLKKSLKLTNNKFLESEIEDLKEFFTVHLNEDCVDKYNDNTTITTDTAATKVLWLQVYLPITIRTIQDEKEVINNCKPLISLKIELKPEVMESEDETTLPYSITDFKVEELEEEEKEEVEENIKDIKDIESIEETDSTDIESNRSILNSILSTLLESKDISLLNLIEDFYIHLEDSNYPAKEVICRDYYYPVFDARHWGRSNNIKNSSSSSGCTTNNLFTLLSCNTTSNISINLTNSPNNLTTTTSTTSVVYRARALYDFQALMQGELSFQENEILLVLANLGNGWLTARRLSSSGDLDSDDVMIGLIPENYIERL